MLSFDRIPYDRPVYFPLDPTKEEESVSFTDWLNDVSSGTWSVMIK